MAIVLFAGELRKLVNGRDEVRISAGDIQACINILAKTYPRVKKTVYDKNGELSDSINIYINGDNIRGLNGISSTLRETDEVNIMSGFAAG
ncbi:hypothetical protein DSCW_52860 [Desulfosarcina widdelii]|uniref:Molybdopterin synthase sulfur carrier subunit n=1 Tax=Desulfosarcina widdelii TaxID=947919 RepID=A0A5K7ZCH0_9BACT|nr:MoaD/ThiS family protein [Desulfosarcina widdelii]BBO77869.1 hypothetical protein DSCW_52860 [Desulfosarcina widdelii]